MNTLRDRVRLQIGYGMPATISDADKDRLIDEFIQNMDADEMLDRCSHALSGLLDDMLYDIMGRVDDKLEGIR